MSVRFVGPDLRDLFANGGEMGEVMRAVDWAATPLGPVERWSPALRTMVGLLLRNHSGFLLWWGPEFVQLYNDAYRPVLGDKHPRSMGQPVAECWSEIWHIIGPMIEAPFRGKPATTSDDLFLLINRKGFVEETHFRVAYSPVPDDTIQGTGIGGVLATVAETTEQVYGERQLRTLRELAARAADAKTAAQACRRAAATFEENAWDVPFALFYLLEEDGEHARLACSVGFGDADRDVAAPLVDLTSDAPAAAVVDSIVAGGLPVVIEPLPWPAASLPTGRWSVPPHAAIALPLASPDQNQPYGVLICGINPHRRLDTGYRSFFELAAAQVVTAIRNARAHEAERRRAEALAELDRAKTDFFSNVSHEFRTPLTLMLGPLEEAIADAEQPLARAQRDRLQLIRRNGLRLQKLVNTLLDFARIEAGRVRASFVPADLSALTADLASSFRSAVENAGLGLIVSCEPMDEPVYVDPPMWEKIVLNLLSNAFKFTFGGQIRIALTRKDTHVELSVEDTGTGIPAHELPRLFERFHRVEGAHGRSYEGTGIGLALVQELVKLHGGEIHVESTLGRGSTFRVSIPRGLAHLAPERVGAAPSLAPTAIDPGAFLSEMAQWTGPGSLEGIRGRSDARILVADDNADMRSYIARLLAAHGHVETVADGVAALAAAQATPPDIIVSDVMMPGMDGLALISRLRAEPSTQTIPVILLSARAGEEATIEGLESGADEYLVKPFSANELIARVRAQLTVSRLRREAVSALRDHAEETTRLLGRAEDAARAREQVLAVVSHDLRSPLAAIDTASDLLQLGLDQKDVMAPGKARKHVAVIRRSIQMMTRLIRDLLDLNSMDVGTFSVELRSESGDQLVTEVIESFEEQAKKAGITLLTELDAPVGALACDRERLLQVLGNLLSNALKFTAAGGTVRVAARRTGDQIAFLVSDTGRGIAPDALVHVFDRHWRSKKDNREGHGLGLAIAKGIVAAHGGTIKVESRVGEGSTFSFSIPGGAIVRAANGAGVAHAAEATA